MFPKEIVLVGVELSSYTEKILTGGWTNRQTGTVLKGRSLSKGHATCSSSIPANKSMRCRLHVKKYGKIDLKHLLQFPAQPSPILGSTENTTFVHLTKKSKYLKANFFIISSNIVLASEWTTSRNQFVL